LEARYAALTFLALLSIGAVIEVDQSAQPFENFGFVIWPSSIATNLWILGRHDEMRFTAALWLGVVIGSWEVV